MLRISREEAEAIVLASDPTNDQITYQIRKIFQGAGEDLSPDFWNGFISAIAQAIFILNAEDFDPRRKQSIIAEMSAEAAKRFLGIEQRPDVH